MTVAANKAESLACMDRARDSIKIGDAVKARRYLEKAKRLDPQQDISYLLKKVESMETSSESSSKDSEDRSYAHDDHYEEPGLRSRKPAKPTPRPAQSPPNSKPEKEKRARSTSRTPKLGVDYTKEQLELVERIRNCKDYYEILKVSKTASEAEIKKEYRKMALQLHPDKCRAPHATEAFKALGNAYAILSDTEKRRQYDLYGADSVSNGPATSRRRDDFFQYDYGHGFEAEYTPEEIFNMFFGGGHPSDNLNRRRQRFNGHAHREEMHNQNENFHGPLIQLLPIILILFLGLVAQLMVGDPPFSLTQSSKYPIKRLTAELKVPYYVRQDFIQSHAGRIKQIENQVEDDHINNLRINCYKEQNQKETLLYRARWQRDEELMMRAQRMATPSCDQLKNIYGSEAMSSTFIISLRYLCENLIHFAVRRSRSMSRPNP